MYWPGLKGEVYLVKTPDGSNIFEACQVDQKVSTHTFMASGSLLVAQKSLLKSKKGSKKCKHMQTPPCLVNAVIFGEPTHKNVKKKVEKV